MIMSLKSFNKGYAFDRRYGPEDNSGKIYEDCVGPLVEKVFQVSTTHSHAFPFTRLGTKQETGCSWKI